MEFFVLNWPRNPGLSTTDYHAIHPIDTGPAPRCSSCGGVIGRLAWLPPYRVELQLFGERFGDIAFGGGGDLLVSERFRDLYKQAHLSGLEGFDPVDVVKIIARKKKLLGDSPKYYYATVTMSRAIIDDKASEIGYEQRWTCPECRIGEVVSAKRVVLEAGSCSGEDVFYARGLPATILVSSRFVEFYKANKIEGAELISATDYCFDAHDSSHLAEDCRIIH